MWEAGRVLDGESDQGAAISTGPKEANRTITSKWEAAKILRGEAENIRRHGLTNVFNLSFNCVQAQVLRTEKCEGCLLGDYVREAYAQEAFPYQFIEPDAWERIDADAGLRERIAARFEQIAEELETSAQAEESVCGQ